MTTPDKYSVVRDVSFGQRVAEEERADLASYFVETEQWRRVWSGDVDVVFAPKGGGKSAIYSMLVSRESQLFDRGVLLAPGENPTGNTAFAEVESAPPTSEAAFVGLWKLYFLVLIAEVLHAYDLRSQASTQLIDQLHDAGLFTGTAAKRSKVRLVMDYVKKYFNPQSAETTLALDPATGSPVAVTAKISFDEPSAEERRGGIRSVDDLFELADSALQDADYEVWLVLDRLDVAFADSRELEENALRALFRAYRDLQPLARIRLKIFLRSDIWRSITAGGFREASHITRELNLEWTEATLLQLVLQRIVRSTALCDFYGVSATGVLADVREQRNLFERVYPAQVEAGSRKPKTLDWCLARTRDGSGTNAPRELIHLLSTARDRQLRRYEIGEPDPGEETIFDRQALKDALPEVSEVRVTKTLYAEYPALRNYLERLEGQKTHHNDTSLAGAWSIDFEEARRVADPLVEVGFFERRGERQRPTYWVPFMYRSALRLVQGSAEGVAPATAVEDE